MIAEQLARELVREAVVDVALHYRSLLGGTGATDPLWRRFQALGSRLDSGDRETVVLVARQAAVDAVSTVLSILDGNSRLPSFHGGFTLLHGPGSKPLNGDLQDFFLETTESDEERT